MTQRESLRILLALVASLSLFVVAASAQDAKARPKAKAVTPEPGSPETKKAAAGQPAFDPKLPNVLLIGDSISIGYTRFVAEMLRGKANVIHAPGNNGDSATVAAGAKAWPTKFPEVKKWDVIHFNCGLHDLKRVKNGKPSNDPKDPRNVDLARYEANLRRIVPDLKATGAKVIFATTTPYPAGVGPARVPEDAVTYNEVALVVMKEQGIAVDDLYSAVLPRLGELQQHVNVHFKPEGSKFLAQQVAQSILEALKPTR
jgi:lysophospholipase L1-like esterase